jgi:hypothetical protein
MRECVIEQIRSMQAQEGVHLALLAKPGQHRLLARGDSRARIPAGYGERHGGSLGRPGEPGRVDHVSEGLSIPFAQVRERICGSELIAALAASMSFGLFFSSAFSTGFS